jgi:hypothetical protein
MYDEYPERSAYPHPNDFKVMRPEYTELEDGQFQAAIVIAPFKVVGRSVSKAGARRAALYEAEKVYRSYHPSHRVECPFPEEFVDQNGTQWKRVKANQRDQLGDYEFIDEDGEDYADIEQMLLWDIRIAEPAEEEQ